MAIRPILCHFQDPVENNMLITVDHLYKTGVEGQLYYLCYKWNGHLSNFLTFVIMQTVCMQWLKICIWNLRCISDCGWAGKMGAH
jgi:hypothetical protein